MIKYAKFVEAQHDREEAPGCDMCANNRVMLEKAWQVGNRFQRLRVQVFSLNRNTTLVSPVSFRASPLLRVACRMVDWRNSRIALPISESAAGRGERVL